MKTRILLARAALAFSLCVSVALGVAAAKLLRSPPPAVVATQTKALSQTGIVRVVTNLPPQTTFATNRFHWQQIVSTNYDVFVTNLRAVGCLERTIRDIIVADVDQLFIARLRELFAPMHRQFWQLFAKFDDAKDEGEHYKKGWEALKEERAAVFKDLLGRENPFEADEQEGRAAEERARWAQQLDFLSPGKHDGVLSLREGCDAAVRKLWEFDHQLTKEEREERQQKQRALETDRDRQLAEALTPEELAEYRLRNSPGANGCLRQSRVEFSENEIRAVARVTAERQEAEGKLGQNTPEANKQRDEVAQRTEAELKAALGGARFADYQRASDNRFEQVSRVVERYVLPAERAVAVYDIQLQAEEQARQLRADNSRPVEERAALLQVIRDEAERSVGAELGQQALATYRQHGGDGWLGSLAVPPKP